jgi:hypothetical protein
VGGRGLAGTPPRRGPRQERWTLFGITSQGRVAPNARMSASSAFVSATSDAARSSILRSNRIRYAALRPRLRRRDTASYPPCGENTYGRRSAREIDVFEGLKAPWRWTTSIPRSSANVAADRASRRDDRTGTWATPAACRRRR